MRKVNLWKNRKAIRLYAILAIIIICVFQAYWLFSVYNDKLDIIRGEAENLLKKTVLDRDKIEVLDELHSMNVSSPTTSILLEFTRLLSKNKINYDIKVDDVGSIKKDLEENLGDSTEVIDTASQEVKLPPLKKKAKNIYNAIKIPIGSIIGNTPFYVYHFHNGDDEMFPRRPNVSETETAQVYSTDSREYYKVIFGNMSPFILRQMANSVLLSLLYTVICISAVLFLMIYVNKSKRLMQQKENFTNNLTHEFKTPMSGISAGIEALITYEFLDDREKTLSYLGMMKSDLNRLINMTDSILYNAKMSDGKMHLNLDNTELHSFVTGITENMVTVLKNKNATVTVAAPDEEIYITADREHFGNVFRNLIDNAIKYSKDDAQIAIALSRQGNFAKILFSDQGIGIPQKYKADIFKPYFRVIENDVYTVKGYGLGLSYIHEVIRMHKGKIRLATEKNEIGTTFEIIIPLSNE